MLYTGIKYIKNRTYCPLSILSCKHDVDKRNRVLYIVQGKQEGVSKLPGKIMESLSWFIRLSRQKSSQSRCKGHC